MVPCAISYGITQPSPIVPPATTRVPGGLPPGMTAYVGTMILLGPTGWSCQAVAFADGGLQQVIHPPGEALPTYNLSGSTTMTVQAIIGYLPARGDGPARSLACPYTAAALSAAGATGLPCSGPPPGESVTRLDANDPQLQDPPHAAGGSALSGGPNPAESLGCWGRRRRGGRGW